MRFLTKTISSIFHPLLMCTWVFIIFTFVNKYAFAGVETGRMGIMVMINTFFFPAFCVFLMWKLEFISSLKMEDKQERTVPFFAVMICYIWAFMVVKQVKAPGFIQLFVMGATISAMLSFITNIFYRLSLHMVGMGALVMLIMLVALLGKVDVAHLLIASVVITGFVGTARIVESDHSLNELYFGLLVGFTGQLIGFVLLSTGGYSIV